MDRDRFLHAARLEDERGQVDAIRRPDVDVLSLDSLESAECGTDIVGSGEHVHEGEPAVDCGLDLTTPVPIGIRDRDGRAWDQTAAGIHDDAGDVRGDALRRGVPSRAALRR